MNVRTLCLSILSCRDASGYEIRKLCTEGEGSYFIEASFGSIYPALAKLETDELVTSRVEHQSGKPSKKIYSITDAGRAAFCEELQEPLGGDVFRSPFLLFARFAHLLDADLVRTRAEERLLELDRKIADLRRIQDELGSREREGHSNDEWVLNHGLTCLEVARKHLHTHMNALIASARHQEPHAGQQAAE
jgi:DNA-binding PadR family transcriptional regulator